jgi:hypothetical protein
MALEMAVLETLGEEALRYARPTGPSLPDFSSLNAAASATCLSSPGRLEFAVEVRRRILGAARTWLPSNCPKRSKTRISNAIRRLPQISVIFYNDTTLARPAIGLCRSADDDRPSTCRSNRPILLWKPSARAQEIGAQVVFADPDSTERPHVPDTYPDSYALHSIPHKQYVEAYRLYPRRALPRSSSSRRLWPGNCRAPTRRARDGGGFAEPARPGARRHGTAAIGTARAGAKSCIW